MASLSAIFAGFGAETYTVRSATALLRDTPDEFTSRIQAAVLLAQTLPVLVTNNISGPLSDILDPTTVTLGCAVITTPIGAIALLVRSTQSNGQLEMPFEHIRSLATDWSRTFGQLTMIQFLLDRLQGGRPTFLPKVLRTFLAVQAVPITHVGASSDWSSTSPLWNR